MSDNIFDIEENTVSRTDKRIPTIILASIPFSIIVAACLAIFTTGELTTNTIVMYIGLIYLNIFSITLPTLGIIESQPWFVWYILVLSWISIGFGFYFIVLQLNDKLSKKRVKTLVTKVIISRIWAIGIVGLIAICGYLLEWSAMHMAEVYIVITLNIFAFPVVFFTPFLEFTAPSWIIIVAMWILRIILSEIE